MSPESTFAALPVRQRGTLEILDTAMKLYRRYFGVIMGWSALTAVLFVLTFTLTCGLGALLVYPLVPGAGCCVIAAAVRGQRITFGQVWDFTKPRFGALILITFLSVLLMGVASGVLSMLWLAISLAGTYLFSAMNAPTEITIVVAVIGSIISTVVSSVLSVVAYAWLGLIPIIACLEDDKRSTAAMGRAWELMKGSWGRVLGLAALLTIAVLAVMGMVGGAMALFGSGVGAFIDDASNTSAVLALLLTFSGFFGLFLLFWNPIQTLVLAVLYLDLRVRKEALDLEWNSYASAPVVQPNAPDVPAAELAANASANEPAPASLSGYAPGSSAPAAPELRPPTPMDDAATPPPSAAQAPSQMRPPAPVSLNKAATSSFSSAPFAPSPPQNAPIAPPSEPVDSQPETFDFSSSFSAGQASDDSFSLDDEKEESGEAEKI